MIIPSRSPSTTLIGDGAEGLRRAVGAADPLAALLLKLDPELIQGVALDAAIATWVNEGTGGATNDQAQATSNKQPLLKDASGLKVVRFDGSNDEMAGVLAVGAMHIYLVAKSGAGSTRMALTWGDGTSGRTFWLGLLNGNLVGSGGQAETDFQGSADDGNLHLWELHHEGGYFCFILDGVLIGRANAQGPPASSALRLGNYATGGSFWSGDHYFVGAIDYGTHAIRAALCTRFGITNGTPQLSGWYLPCFDLNDVFSYGIFRVLKGTDGINWTEQIASFPTSSASTNHSAGDYSAMQHGGKFYCVYTRTRDFTQALDSFGLSVSEDGIEWQKLPDVDCSEITGAARIWAPEWFIDPNDGTIHTFFACSVTDDSGQFQIYTKSTTDFVTWTDAVLIGGMSGGSFIDPFVVYTAGQYFLWVKNEATGQKIIEVYKCATLTGSYTAHRTGDWMGIGSGFEGPTLRIVAGVPRLYCVDYSVFGMGYTEQTSGDWTSNGSTGWSAMTYLGGTAPFSPNHGTPIQLP